MSLEHLLCFIIALGPGLFWLFLLSLRYRPDREGKRMILKTFLLGMVICTPAGFLNTWLASAIPTSEDSSWVSHFILFMFVVGPNEEGMKFLILWSEVFRRWRFRTEMDGIIFATASALGFATYENALYMLKFGIKVLWPRAWACALAHMGFSAIFGYYLGLAKSKKYNPRPCIVEGLVLAAVFHGLYDISVTFYDHAIYVVVPLLLGYYLFLTHGLMKPILSVIAPRWMVYDPKGGEMFQFQRRRFPVQRREPSAGEVIAVLEALDSLSDEDRIQGIGLAQRVLDQRIFERVQQLTHDPVDGVREEAERVHKELRRKLRDGKLSSSWD